MYQKEIDEMYMQRCLQLARNGMLNAKPNPMVGAVIVYDGRIIGEGYHVCYGSAHAEVNAFASVSASDNALLTKSTLYVSLEPCSHYGKTPPCADLIINKGVRRVVVGCIDAFAEVRGRGIEKMRSAGIDVSIGVLERECLRLNRRFMTFQNHHRPYITLKWAQSANGFVDDDFKPMTVSVPFTKMLSHKLRAENDAILVGRITAERDKSRLNVRHWSGRNPMRLVLTHDTTIARLMSDLYEKNVQSLIVEGGTITHNSFIEAGLWDEIRIETAKFEVSGGTKAPRLPQNARLVSCKKYDGNVIETYERS